MGCSYKDFEEVLRKAKFDCEEGKRHKKYKKIVPETGKVYIVFVSRQGSSQIGKKLYHEMLKQAGMTHEEFECYRKNKN